MAVETLTETHYEIQIRRGERWIIDRVQKDRQAAFATARELAANGDVEGVRVIKECYRPSNAQATAITVHEWIRPVRHDRPHIAVEQPTARPPATPPTSIIEQAPVAPARSWSELAPTVSIGVAAALAAALRLAHADEIAPGDLLRRTAARVYSSGAESSIWKLTFSRPLPAVDFTRPARRSRAPCGCRASPSLVPRAAECHAAQVAAPSAGDDVQLRC